MTQHQGSGEQPPPGPPAYPPPPPPNWVPTPGSPVPPPPRKRWGAGRIVLVTVAGLLLVAGLLIAGLFTLGMFLDQPTQDARRDADGRVLEKATVSKDALRTGDCVNDAALRDLEPGGGMETQSDTVEVVPCKARHDFEVTAAFTVPDADYSEADDLRKAVHQGCVRRLRAEWAKDRQLLRDKILAYYLPPEWSTQDDPAVCMLQLASSEQMRGSIR